MTRAMCSKTSSRKHITRSQDATSGNEKENSSCIQSKALSQNTNNRNQVKTRSTVLTIKENFENEVVRNTQSSCSPQNDECSFRKSERHRKSSYNTKEYIYNFQKNENKTDSSTKTNVLSDKTNSPLTIGTKVNKGKESLKQQNKITKALNKGVNITKATRCSASNESHEEKVDGKHHIPVYQTVDILVNNCNFPITKKETVYDFDEVDENEEPVKKKKKKKPNVKKPRIGPKALTINNIKYSSTESLVSLPEKPVRRKKVNLKLVPLGKSLSSVNNLNDTASTCSSMQSFMSQPPSSLSCNKNVLKKKHELSVLQETQSENCQDSVHERSNILSNVVNRSEVMDDNHLNPMKTNISLALSDDSYIPTENVTVSHQRCYPSKKSHSDLSHEIISQCRSINDTLPNQFSNHCSENISTGSSHDFLSSTPCKRTSLVVCHNSVFSESYETDLPNQLRTKEPLENMVSIDNCFGFDEPEELEEPLLSPIKNINLPDPKILPRRQHELFGYNDTEHPKLDPKEVIERLKASIPKSKTKEASDVYHSDSSSTNHSTTSSPVSKEVETSLTFTKPPRRSYERQRRVRYHSDYEEKDSEEENCDSQQEGKHDNSQELEDAPKPTKKCYQKKNQSKVFKAPHVPKAKQKLLKEEEELERFAAQVNAQFQEIDKCNLVVE